MFVEDSTVWGEILSSREVEYCERLLEELDDVSWVQPLLKRVRAEGFSYHTKPLLFELRFAAEIQRRRIEAEYESPTGVGHSSVDFRLRHEGTEWLIELVSVLTSDAVRQATRHYGILFETTLSSDADDPRQSEEGELILVQQKIGEKVLVNGNATKFPEPGLGTFNLILVDMRGHGLTGGDVWDYREIAYGAAGLHGNTQYFRHYYRTPNGERVPLLGLFDPKNDRQRAAAAVQRRVQFLGFTADERYEPETLVTHAYYLANPLLLRERDETVAAYERYPLHPRP